MEALRNILTRILNALTGISFLVMVVLTCWQVFTRYVLQNPSTWSEELVGYLFGWVSMLGACIVTSERGHMNIPLLVEKCGKTGAMILNCLSEVIAFAFAAIILLWGGIKITNLTMGQMTSSLGVPLGVFYVVLPICGVLSMIYTILNIIDILRGKTISTPEADDSKGAM